MKERIVVRAPNWVGDAVMSLPALQHLRATRREAHIAVLARPAVADVYRREPACNEVIMLEGERGWKGAVQLRRAARSISDFDTAILFQNAFEAAVIARLARIPRRIGYDRDGRHMLLTDAIPVPKMNETAEHERFYYLELLKRARMIGGYGDAPVRLHSDSESRERGRLWLQTRGVSGPVVGVSPGAAYGGAKRWIPERFAESASLLAADSNGTVAVFGGAAEREIGDEVARLCKGRNFAGETTLDEFIDIASVCSVFLSNDSGPMHIASALAVPTVAVFGPTNERATGPVGDFSRVVRQTVECSPCLLRECPIDHRCMTRVSAEQVASAARKLMQVKECRPAS